ncbi:hypothetical protein ACSHT2_10035 [Bradyrhizobium sp. PUT101]|uniref:hypothetical protein n=1 Tax=Bradyrhizobium sp. PUT101 TaxID=3447427 RepID=UPI003F8321AC
MAVSPGRGFRGELRKDFGDDRSIAAPGVAAFDEEWAIGDVALMFGGIATFRRLAV